MAKRLTDEQRKSIAESTARVPNPKESYFERRDRLAREEQGMAQGGGKPGDAFRAMVEGTAQRHGQAQSKGLFAAWIDAQRLTLETRVETKVTQQIRTKAENYESVRESMARAVAADARLEQMRQEADHYLKMQEVQRLQQARAAMQPQQALPWQQTPAIPRMPSAPPLPPAHSVPPQGAPSLMDQVAIGVVLAAEENGMVADYRLFMEFFGDVMPGLMRDYPGLDMRAVADRATQLRAQAGYAGM